MVKKDMELSVKKLLDNYFSKEQIRDALRERGESASGNKNRLARRLHDYWEFHNLNIYELLNFSDVDSLEMICHHYKLDVMPKEKDALKERIEKANLLVLDKKPAVVIDRNHDSRGSKPKVSKIKNNKSNLKKLKTKPKVDDDKLNHKKSKTEQKRGFSLKKLFSKLTQ